MELLFIALVFILLTLVITITISKHTKKRIIRYVPLVIYLAIIIYCCSTEISISYPTSINDMVRTILLFIMLPCFVINLLVCLFLDFKYWLNAQKDKKKKTKKEKHENIPQAHISLLSPRELGWRFGQWLVTLVKKKK